MNDYNNLSWLRYIVCLVTGSSVQLPNSLVIPGWRWDLVYFQQDHRRCWRYVPSRLVRAAERARYTVELGQRWATGLVGWVSSDHPVVALTRWFFTVIATAIVQLALSFVL